MHLGSYFPNSLQARRVEVSVCFTFPQQLCVLFSEGQSKRDQNQSNAPGNKKKKKTFPERPPLGLIEVYNIETSGRQAGGGDGVCTTPLCDPAGGEKLHHGQSLFV